MGGCFFQFSFLHSWFWRPSGTALFVLIVHRTCPKWVKRNGDLKELFSELSMNFWYGVVEDKYLKASALGSDVVTIKKTIP
jgi:hypothetical protein